MGSMAFAGAGPTASAVLGDLAALIAGGERPVFGVPVSALEGHFADDSAISQIPSRYLIRVELVDKAGALASLTEALASSDVSVDVLLQDSAGTSGYAPIAIMTHMCSNVTVKDALARINALSAVHEPARLFRIESN